jgi:hypothetical protein
LTVLRGNIIPGPRFFGDIKGWAVICGVIE